MTVCSFLTIAVVLSCASLLDGRRVIRTRGVVAAKNDIGDSMERRSSRERAKGRKGGNSWLYLAGEEPQDDKNEHWRPNYFKHEKCEDAGSSCTEYAPCESVQAKDCMKPAEDHKEYALVLDVQESNWKVFRSIVEIKCPEFFQHVKYKIKVWSEQHIDNWEVWQNNEPLKGQLKINQKWEFTLNTSTLGAGDSMEIKFEFANPTPGKSFRAGYVYYWGEWDEGNLTMDCADNQVCLKALGISSEARELRNRNQLQLNCLQGRNLDARYQTVCDNWRTCLEDNKDGNMTEDGIRLLLTAGMKGDGPGHMDRFPPGCINPRYSDPEGWACSCLKDWERKCKEINYENDEDCFTASFCVSNLVCPGWKDYACQTPRVKDIEELLQRSSSLEQHAFGEDKVPNIANSFAEVNALGQRFDSHVDELTLDRSSSAKSCT